MKCHILRHFISVFTVCQSTPLGVSSIQRVKRPIIVFAAEDSYISCFFFVKPNLVKIYQLFTRYMHIMMSTFWLKVGRSTALTLEQGKGHQELISSQITNTTLVEVCLLDREIPWKQESVHTV